LSFDENELAEDYFGNTDETSSSVDSDDKFSVFLKIGDVNFDGVFFSELFTGIINNNHTSMVSSILSVLKLKVYPLKLNPWGKYSVISKATTADMFDYKKLILSYK
jgi:hypothetical protein